MLITDPKAKRREMARRNSRVRDIYPISLRELEVSEIIDLSPRMRRVIFTGEDLRANNRFGVAVPDLVSMGFDDDIRMIFPEPTNGRRPFPPPLSDGRLQWTAEINGLFRTYTVRAFDRVAGTLSVDFVRHGTGLASQWVAGAKRGDRLYIAGPKACGSLPSHCASLVLIGDETALPAVARCLEDLHAEGADTRVTAVIEVADEQEVIALTAPAGADIRWQLRSRGESLLSGASELNLAGVANDVFVWGAGESSALKPLRSLVRDAGVSPENTEFVGYWKQREAATHDDGTVDTSDVATSAYGALGKLHEMAEVAPALVIRRACELDIFRRIADGATTPEILAEACGTSSDSVRRLLRYLESIGLLRTDNRGYGLTELGTELADPESHGPGMFVGPHAERAWRLRELGQQATQPPLTSAESSNVAANAAAIWVAPAFASVADLSGIGRLSVSGAGAGAFAQEMLRTHPELRVDIVAGEGEFRSHLESVEPRLRERLGRVDEPGDAEILLDPFLSGAEPSSARTFVVSKLLLETGDEEEMYEEDLLRLVDGGGRVPTADNLDGWARGAGYERREATAIGWGWHLVELEKSDS